jgi:hypothetical protein
MNHIYALIYFIYILNIILYSILFYLFITAIIEVIVEESIKKERIKEKEKQLQIDKSIENLRRDLLFYRYNTNTLTNSTKPTCNSCISDIFIINFKQ